MTTWTGSGGSYVTSCFNSPNTTVTEANTSVTVSQHQPNRSLRGLKGAPMKPGWQTSEFYVTLVAQVAALVALFHPSALDVVRAHQDQVQAAATLAAAIAAAYYAHSRGKVKAAITPVP